MERGIRALVKRSQGNEALRVLLPDLARAYRYRLYSYIDPQRAQELYRQIPTTVRPVARLFTSPIDKLVKEFARSPVDPERYYRQHVQRLHRLALEQAGFKDADPSLIPQIVWSPLGSYSPYLRYAPWVGGALALISLLGAVTQREKGSKWPLILGLLGLGTMAAPLLNRWYATYRDRQLWTKVLEAIRKKQQGSGQGQDQGQSPGGGQQQGATNA